MSDLTDYEKLFEDDVSRESDNRSAALEDIRFARLGEQWPEAVRLDRQREGRPCLTINRLPSFIRQVVNDSRMNKPQIKVKAVDSTADVETAEILSGLIRNIEYTSRADVAYDTAIDSSATCGMGFFRICTDYTSDDEFTQDIQIERITNPLSVVFDSYSDSIDGSDWKHAFLVDWITKDEYRQRFGGKFKDDDITSFSGSIADGMSHIEGDLVRIAEFWEVTENAGKLLLLSDGTVINEKDYLADHPEIGMPVKDIMESMGVTFVQERKVMSRAVKQRVLGSDVLDEQDWAGKYIPIIPVFGEEIFYQGRRVLKSLIRDAKDPQQMLNFWRTASTELVALAPKAPYLGPVGAFKTDSKKWASANNKSWPFIEFDGPAMPQRQAFAGPPAGALQEALNASDDIKSIMGIFDASIGARSNETSGRAIIARQREGDVSTFHFIDNLAKSISHAGRILVDLIPKIYDTARVIRTLGLDGGTESIKINQQTEHKGVQRIFDLKTGKYDVAVDTGPSFTTQREEAATQMMELVKAFPDAAPLIGDLLAKNLDWPDSEEIAKRLKIMLPPQLQEQEGADGPPIPPQVQQMIEQGKQQISQMEQAIQQLQSELQQAAQANQALEQQANNKTADAQAKQVDSEMKLQIEQMNANIKMRELEIKEQELAIKVKELELHMHQVMNPGNPAGNVADAAQGGPGGQGAQAAQSAQGGQSNDALAMALNGFAETLSIMREPKRVIRDADGRIEVIA